MNLSRRVALFITLFSVALMLTVLFSLAQAAPLGAPNGGVVGTGTPASCTQAALDAKLSGGGSLTFNCGVNPHTIVLTSSKTITVNTTLDGGGKITLSGGDANKIFWVNAGVRLTLNNITLAHGNSSMGGCVTVQGTLNATQATFRDCTAFASLYPGSGGAIYSWGGTVALTDSVVLNNTVVRNGGGIYLLGGQATLNHVDVLSNTAWFTHTGSGGGVYVAANTTFVASNSRFNYNRIGWLGQGGGLAVYTSTALLVNVSADYNEALNAADGGGFYAQNSQFTLQGGSANGNYGLYGGGGLMLRNTVTSLSNATINGNRVSSTGGGISAYQGSLALNNVTLNHNYGEGDGGGLDLYDTPTSLVSVTVNYNHGERNGGGIHAYRSALTLDRVTVSGNEAAGNQGDGGGIYNSEGTLNAINSIIDHNTSSNGGGGFFNESDSSVILTNVTVSANTANTQGGAFYNEDNFTINDRTYITLTNVTVKDNRAAQGGGLWNGPDAYNLVYLKNSVIADSVGGNCYGKALTTAQYSLFTDSTCVVSSGTGNLSHTPAGLFPLMDNGGQTRTHLPSPTSPLVSGVTGVDFPGFDQRGVVRPQGLAGDIGAVERRSVDVTIAPRLYLPLIRR